MRSTLHKRGQIMTSASAARRELRAARLFLTMATSLTPVLRGDARTPQLGNPMLGPLTVQ